MRLTIAHSLSADAQVTAVGEELAARKVNRETKSPLLAVTEGIGSDAEIEVRARRDCSSFVTYPIYVSICLYRTTIVTYIKERE